LAFGWASVIGCVGPHIERVAGNAQAVSQGPLFAGAVCGSDRRFFFADVALGYGAAPVAFAGQVEAALQNVANASRAVWFDCVNAPDANACLEAQKAGVLAYVVPVLPPRTGACFNGGPCWRDDGHLRFFRIFFRPASDTAAFLSIVESERCAVTLMIREIAAAYAGAAAPGIRVGREWCPTTAMGGEAYVGQPGQATAGWHLSAVGAGDSRFPSTPAAMTLLDTWLDTAPTTGTVPTYQDQANLFDETGAPVPTTSDTHPHGAAVSEVIRSIADPMGLPIWSYTTLDSQGSGGITHLARAIDLALFDARGRNLYTQLGCATTPTPICPLIPPSYRTLLAINLSLGWPPEQEVTRLVIGPSCKTTEDGMAESVRYLLNGALSMDSPSSPILAIAAAGNRATTALPPGLSAPEMFFPAELSRTHCNPNCTSALSLAVGAVDELALPSSVSISGAEPALVAPGEHVYAGPTSFLWPATSPSFMCGSSPPSFRLQYTAPSVFTGTSMAAAIASGAAARVYAAHVQRRVAMQEAPLSGSSVARLLYATGVAVGRVDATGVGVREICIPGAFDALDDPRWPELAACVVAPDGLSLSRALEGCVTALGFDGKSSPCAVSTGSRLGWPSTYSPDFEAPPVCQAGDASGISPGQWISCTPGSCPIDDFSVRDRYSAGGTGSQPGSTGCPECGVTMARSIGSAITAMTVVINLSADYPAGTTFSTSSNPPYLYVTNGTSAWTLALKPDFVPNDWIPGAAFFIENVPLPPGIDPTSSAFHASVVSMISQAGKVPVRDISSLRVTLR
jgi:hypothetical protein